MSHPWPPSGGGQEADPPARPEAAPGADAQGSEDRFDAALAAGVGRLALFMLALIVVTALAAWLGLHFEGA